MRVTLQDIIANAVRKEQAARKFYLKAKRMTQDPIAKALLEGLAKEEARHASLLRGKDVEAFLGSKPPAIQDLRITEFLVPRRISPNASFQDVLIYAMKREDSSFWAYQALAEAAEDNKTRMIFRRLAGEERLHRNKLEKLYDDVIFREN